MKFQKLDFVRLRVFGRNRIGIVLGVRKNSLWPYRVRVAPTDGDRAELEVKTTEEQLEFLGAKAGP